LDVKASTYLISSPNLVHDNNAEGQPNAESKGIHLSRNWIYLVEFAIKKFLTRDATVGDFIFPLGGKAGTTNFLIVAKSSGLRLKEHCHFFDFI
jgi:hypothetical protein